MAKPVVSNCAGESPAGQHDACLNAAIDAVLDNEGTCRDLVDALGDGPITPDRLERARGILGRRDAQVAKIVLADELRKLAEKPDAQHEVVEEEEDGDPQTATHLLVCVPLPAYWEKVTHNHMRARVLSLGDPVAANLIEEAELLYDGDMLLEIPEALRGFRINCWPLACENDYYVLFDRDQEDGLLAISCRLRGKTNEKPEWCCLEAYLMTPNGDGPNATLNGETGEVLQWHSDTRYEWPIEVIRAAEDVALELRHAGPTGADSRIDKKYLTAEQAAELDCE